MSVCRVSVNGTTVVMSSPLAKRCAVIAWKKYGGEQKCVVTVEKGEFDGEDNFTPRTSRSIMYEVWRETFKNEFCVTPKGSSEEITYTSKIVARKLPTGSRE